MVAQTRVVAVGTSSVSLDTFWGGVGGVMKLSDLNHLKQ